MKLIWLTIFVAVCNVLRADTDSEVSKILISFVINLGFRSYGLAIVFNKRDKK